MPLFGQNLMFYGIFLLFQLLPYVSYNPIYIFLQVKYTYIIQNAHMEPCHCVQKLECCCVQHPHVCVYNPQVWTIGRYQYISPKSYWILRHLMLGIFLTLLMQLMQWLDFTDLKTINHPQIMISANNDIDILILAQGASRLRSLIRTKGKPHS